MEKEVKKKDVAKAYEKYSRQFTPRPTYFVKMCIRDRHCSV